MEKHGTRDRAVMEGKEAVSNSEMRVVKKNLLDDLNDKEQTWIDWLKNCFGPLFESKKKRGGGKYKNLNEFIAAEKNESFVNLFIEKKCPINHEVHEHAAQELMGILIKKEGGKRKTKRNKRKNKRKNKGTIKFFYS
jgi:hypothetical protein